MKSRGTKSGIGNETYRAAIMLFHLDEIVHSNIRLKYDYVSSGNPCLASSLSMETTDGGDDGSDNNLAPMQMKPNQTEANKETQLEDSTLKPKSKLMEAPNRLKRKVSFLL